MDSPPPSPPARRFRRQAGLTAAATLAGLASLPAVDLGSESFENPGGTPEAYSGNPYLGSFFVDGTDYFALRDLSVANPPLGWGGVDVVPVTGQDGNWAVVSEDVDDPANPIGSAGPAIIRLANIDVSAHSNLQVTVRLGTHVAWNSNWEIEDTIRIEYAFDQPGDGLPASAGDLSSTGYSVAGAFYGNGLILPSGPGFNDGPVLDTNGNGAWDPSETIKIPSDGSMQDFAFAIPGTGNNLSVQVVVAQSGGSEEVVIDHIRVTGDPAATEPPVLVNVEAGPATFTEGNSPVQVTNTLTVADPDSPIVSATARIQLNNQPGEDVLSIDGTLPAGIAALPYDAASGTLSLTGPATPADFQAALRQVQYSNTSTNPNAFLPRVVRFQVDDGINFSNTQDRQVMVEATITEPLPIPHTEDFNTDGDGERYTSNSFSDGLATPADYFERTDANPHPGQHRGAGCLRRKHRRREPPRRRLHHGRPLRRGCQWRPAPGHQPRRLLHRSRRRLLADAHVQFHPLCLRDHRNGQPPLGAGRREQHQRQRGGRLRPPDR